MSDKIRDATLQIDTLERLITDELRDRIIWLRFAIECLNAMEQMIRPMTINEDSIPPKETAESLCPPLEEPAQKDDSLCPLLDILKKQVEWRSLIPSFQMVEWQILCPPQEDYE